MFEYSKQKRETTKTVERYRIVEVEYMPNNILKLEKDGQIYYALMNEGVISGSSFYAKKEAIFELPEGIEKNRLGKAGEFVSLFRDGGGTEIKRIQSISGKYITTEDGEHIPIDQCIVSNEHVVIPRKDKDFQKYFEIVKASRGEENRIARLTDVQGNVGIFQYENGEKTAALLEVGDENAYLEGSGPIRIENETETDEIEEIVQTTPPEPIPPREPLYYGPVSLGGKLVVTSVGLYSGWEIMNYSGSWDYLQQGNQVAGYLAATMYYQHFSTEDQLYATNFWLASQLGITDTYKVIPGRFEILETDTLPAADLKARLVFKTDTDELYYYPGLPFHEYIIQAEHHRVWRLTEFSS